MPRLSITPWRYTTDLLDVRQQLYRLDGPGTDNRRHAVDRIMAWRFRGNLPHAVESTALLVDAFSHHENSSNSSFSIRAVYAAAFCRFVTGYCDIGRNKERSLEPSSMLEIARQIDMPVEFVALRHEATHEDLPSEQRIVSACGDALQWLWRVYWSRLDELDSQHSSLSMDGQRESARRLFREHRDSSKQLLKTRAPALVKASSADQAVQRFFADGIDAYTEIAEETVAKCLLIPTDRRIGQSMDGAFLLWDDLLLAFARQAPRFLCSIVDGMISVLSAEANSWDDAIKEAYRSWLFHLACSSRWNEPTDTVSLELTTRIMKHCVLYSNKYTFPLGQQILAEANDDFRDLWIAVLDASQPATLCPRARTADDKQRSRDQRSAASENILESASWQKSILEPKTPVGVTYC